MFTRAKVSRLSTRTTAWKQRVTGVSCSLERCWDGPWLHPCSSQGHRRARPHRLQSTCPGAPGVHPLLPREKEGEEGGDQHPQHPQPLAASSGNGNAAGLELSTDQQEGTLQHPAASCSTQQHPAAPSPSPSWPGSSALGKGRCQGYPHSQGAAADGIPLDRVGDCYPHMHLIIHSLLPCLPAPPHCRLLLLPLSSQN